MSKKELVARFGHHGIYPRKDSPNFPLHPLARRAGIALIEWERGMLSRCGIIPCLIDRNGVAQPVRRGSAGWSSALLFGRKCVRTATLQTSLVERGWVFGGADVIDVLA